MRNFLFISVMILGLNAFMQVKAGVPEDKSYNLQRGIECVEDENYREALEFFEKEVKEHPKNGSAWCWMASVYQHQEQNGLALDAANKALKYLSKKETSLISCSYRYRADIYAFLGDTVKALSDLQEAVKTDPSEVENYKARGELFYQLDRLAESNADFKKIIELEPGNVIGYMFLGRNYNDEKRYDQAIKLFSEVTKLTPNFSESYAYRAESYRQKKEYSKAVDDAIAALNLAYDYKAACELRHIADSTFTLVDIKLRAQMKKFPHNAFWPYMMALINQDARNHQKAIDHYLKAAELDAHPSFFLWAAKEAEEAGDYNLAITLFTKGYELDTTHTGFLLYRAMAENNNGEILAALKDIDKFIEDNPDNSDGYHQRGWFKDKNHISEEEALDDYTTSIGLNPDYCYNYLTRGQIYRNQGKVDLAKADFEKVLSLDTTYSANGAQAAEYALLYLGRKEEASVWLDSLLANDESSGIRYDAACLYSLMGNLDRAFEYLEEALKMGYAKFVHIERDDDLDNLRKHPGYAELIEKYKKTHQENLKKNAPDKEDDLSAQEAEIPFSREGGVCKVNCTINGLPLYFIFDTGASEVTLSMIEANFMLKNDYLSRKDLSGKEYYQIADGSISEGMKVILKEVNFGGVTLKNVKASIVKSQKAPLLLGQSVLQRLGKIEIDNENKMILINKKK